MVLDIFLFFIFVFGTMENKKIRIHGDGDGDGDVDRISKLPEETLHIILSKLSMEDAIRFSTVSKIFFSAARSSPVLDFDYTIFSKKSSASPRDKLTSYESFLDFVFNSVERRRRLSLTNNNNNNTDVSLQRLRFLGPESRYVINDRRVEHLVNFALEKKVVELDLHIFLPTLIFSSQHLKILKLSGLTLKGYLQDYLVLSSPLIEQFDLTRCTILKLIDLSECANLKHLVFDSVYGLEKVNLHPLLCLESFSCIDSPYIGKIIKLFLLESLKLLEIRDTEISIDHQEWLHHHVSQFNLLQTLKLIRCLELKHVHVSSNSLKILELDCFSGLDNVSVVARNLESFIFCVDDQSKKNFCDIDICSCINLKHIKLKGVDNGLTDKFFSGFGFLEGLELENCRFSLNKIDFYGGSLRKLKLLECHNLCRIDIAAPNLVSFEFSGFELPLLLPLESLSSRIHEPKIKVTTPHLDVTDRFLERFRDFLASFGHCQRLSLCCSYSEALIFPKEMRENMIPPLYWVKHLKVQVRSFQHSLVQLIEHLLWLVPCVESMSITISYHRVTKPFKLEFQCKPAVEEDVDEFGCKPLLPGKLWEDYLVEAEKNNFEDLIEERSRVHNFLCENGKPITIFICPFRDSSERF
ncbi:uncharacterized protein LOC107431807 [Ziziphus jujuba]|uniref:Uncharacterized protein LOC107431807 n=1 Tax=Ziziphus jujuba TaxID=326968 RepID=A0A6P4APL0_ZIZJJ|nr:uncharacterized protein LOC107431807 [Ziziphus jujuba]